MALHSSEAPASSCKLQQPQIDDGHMRNPNGLHAAQQDHEHAIEDECAQKQIEDQREYVACLKCTNDCFNSPHSAVSFAHKPLPSTAPCFMTVVDDLSYTRLEIPQGFAEPSLSRCLGQAKLEGPSGWVWYVPLIRGTNDNCRMLALGSPGWDDFASDHSLQSGDLLVLTYFSIRQLFKVRIFDAAEGVEKSQQCLPSKPHFISLPHQCINEKPTKGMGTQIYDNMAESLDDSQNQTPMCNIIKEKDCHQLQFEEPKSELSKPKSTVSICNGEIGMVNCYNYKSPEDIVISHNANISDLKDKVVESNYKTHEHIIQMPTRKTVTPVTSSENQGTVIDHNDKALVPFKIGSTQIDQKDLVPSSRYKASFQYCKCATSRYNPYAIASPAERERVEREARAFYSKNPFTIKSITASSIYKDRKLFLPKVFTNVYLPNKEAWMTWVDSKGKQWRCAWLPHRRYKKHVSFVSAGWAAFVNAHHLIEHDVCIFELIHKDALHFRVHIFKQRPFDGSLP